LNNVKETVMDTEVLIAGGGPTGLMLACELRLAGVDVHVVDRLTGRSGESRAGGIHPRTMEVLDQRGLLDRFLAKGRPMQAGHFSGLRLDFSQLDTRYPFTLNILQASVEQLMEQRAAELGVHVHWSSGVTAIRQDADGVTVDIGDEQVRAQYLVGCDGGRSTVRKLTGIDFPGTDATMSSMLGDVELADPPPESIFQERGATGDFAVFAFEPGWYRVLTSTYDGTVDRDAPAGIEDLRASLISIAGTDYGMHSPRWVSRFSDTARQATEYRHGRVLLAGDAAHIHFPAGGQGMNLGLQDAVNLGWKLAATVHGDAPHSLLDTYHAERHPVAARVLHNTRAQTALARPGEHISALRDILTGLIGLDDVNNQLGGMISALDVHYPLGDGHPLLGRRMPDIDLATESGERRMYSLLHDARPVLLDLGTGVDLRAVSAGRADVVNAQPHAQAPTAVLVRPDGYVGWVPSSGIDLDAALTTWFGRARAGAQA
jgi:2-polyprenyl-6-methoxyphenol hydroxylase-like FAD-dependent oxidoreductase